MTATDYAALLQRVHAEASEWSIDVDLKKTRKIMDAVKERIHKREAEEAVKTRRRNKETAALAQAAEEEARASVAAAERQGATMAAGLAQAEQDIKEALGDALGPEPDAFETALMPPQELPPLALDQIAGMEQLCERIRSLAGSSAEAASLTASDAGAIAICQGLLPSCPDQDSAQAVFGAVSFAVDGALATAACRTLLRWAGVPELAQANDTLLLDALELEDGPTTTATCTTPWLPGAADFLSALQRLGCSKATTAKATGTSGQARAGAGGASTTRASTPAAGADADNAAPLPATNLQLVLRLLAVLLQLQGDAGSASAAQRPKVAVPEGHGRALLLALLHLHMDSAVRAVSLPQLQAAIAALIDAFGDTEWSRVAPDVVVRLGEPIGPSHRAAVRLLRELPGRGARVRALRQAAGLALLRTLVYGKNTAASSKGTSRARGSSIGASPSEVREVLSGQGKMLELAHGRKGKKADYWLLLSVLDAADLVLWSHVDAPGGNSLDEPFIDWFQQWMQRLSKELRSAHLAHYVRTRLSELENHYSYCAQLGCVGGEQAEDGA